MCDNTIIINTLDMHDLLEFGFEVQRAWSRYVHDEGISKKNMLRLAYFSSV